MKEIRSSDSAMVSLRGLLGIQVEMSNKQLDM